MQLQSGIVLISRKRSSDLSKLTKRAQRSANKHSDSRLFPPCFRAIYGDNTRHEGEHPEIIFCSEQKGTSRMRRMWSPDAMVAASVAINAIVDCTTAADKPHQLPALQGTLIFQGTLMFQRGKPKPCIQRKLKMPAKDDEIVSQ
jgi:hypothetical protein